MNSQAIPRKASSCFASLSVLLSGPGVTGDVKPLSAATCPGDVDCDGVVDGADLSLFSADLGRTDCTSQVVPKGVILMWAGDIDRDGHPIVDGAPDTHWLICDGRDVDGDGMDDVPDLRDRFIVGAGGNYNLHDSGGQERIALSVEHLPSHQHGLNAYTDCVIHGHRYARNAWADFWIGGLVPTRLSFPGEDFSETTGREYHGFNSTLPEESRCFYDPEDGPEPGHRHKISGATSPAGAGLPAENRPPFHAVYFIMKVAP